MVLGVILEAAVLLPFGVLHRHKNAFVTHLVLPVFLRQILHRAVDAHRVVASVLRVLHHTPLVQETVFPVVELQTARGDDRVGRMISLEQFVADQAVLHRVSLVAVEIWNVPVAVRRKLAPEDSHAAVAGAARVMERSVTAWFSAIHLKLK